jgi:hypothetical protein
MLLLASLILLCSLLLAGAFVVFPAVAAITAVVVISSVADSLLWPCLGILCNIESIVKAEQIIFSYKLS